MIYGNVDIFMISETKLDETLLEECPSDIILHFVTDPLAAQFFSCRAFKFFLSSTLNKLIVIITKNPLLDTYVMAK